MTLQPVSGMINSIGELAIGNIIVSFGQVVVIHRN